MLGDFATDKIMKEQLLAKWSELLERQKQQQLQQVSRTGGIVQQEIFEQLPVLQALRAAGCSQIPGEVLDIGSMIREREQMLRNFGAL